MAHNPGVVRADASVGVGEALAAGDDPGRNAHDEVADDQGATGVSVAHALASGVQGADDVVVHKLAVDDVMAAAALGVGDGVRGQGLQVVGQHSLVLNNGQKGIQVNSCPALAVALPGTYAQESPSGDDGGHGFDVRGSDANGLDEVGVGEGGGHLDQGDVVGETGTVVLGVVNDQAALVTDSAGGEQVGADDHGDAVVRKVLRAVGGREHPAGPDDRGAAEVVSVGTTQGGEVRKLAGQRVLSTDNARLHVEIGDG